MQAGESYAQSGRLYEWDDEEQCWVMNDTGGDVKEHEKGAQIQGNPRSSKTLADSGVRLAKKRKKESGKQGWVHAKVNTSVYVTGIPLDSNEDEVYEAFKKCGIVKRHAETGEFRVKLYRDDTGALKGDGVVVYLMPASVDLAIQILDESEIRGHQLSVSAATFSQKEKEKPSSEDGTKTGKVVTAVEGWKRPKGAVRKFDQLGALRWDDDAEEKIMNVLILSNVFTPYELIDDSELHDDIIEDMKMKCSQFGEVLKVKLYPNTSPGVVSVVFREGKAAFEASKKCEGLSYNKHRLSAELYDGVTNYDVPETEELRLRRLEKFSELL